MTPTAPAFVCAVVSLVALVPAPAARGDEPAPPSESPPVTAPMTTEAKAHYDRGLTLYAGQQFAAAIRELEQGYTLEPRPEFLFAEAQAFRLGGDCSRAVPLYRQFLDASPSPIQIQATRLALGRCGPERASAPPPVPPPRPVGTAPVGALERPSWWKDPWALSSIGVGVAALALGVGLVVASNHARGDATSARTMNYFEFTPLWDEAEQRRAIGVTSLIAGAALVATGAVRLAILRRRDRAEDGAGHARSRAAASPATLSFHAGPRGGAVVWGVAY